MKRGLVNLVLLVCAILLVAGALLIGAPRSGGEEGEKFGGTDAAVTEMLEDQGHEPWFEPLFSPSSSEVESGLFAMQAALGAGVLGYCLGALRGRRRGERQDRPEQPTGPAARRA